MMKLNRRQLVGGVGALLGAAPFIRTSRADTPVQLLSHRYPGLEFYAARFKDAIPGVEVNVQLMPVDKQTELASIALSSKSSSLDLVYVHNGTISLFASKGWLYPLDKLWEKYKDEYNLGDFSPAILDEYRYKGELFGIPGNTTVGIFAYRKDVFDAAGLAPPKTIAEYAQLAKKLNSPIRAGTTLCLKPGDGIYTEVHWHMNAVADGWFDKDWRPLFNSDRAVAAVETIKEVAKSAPPGYTAAGTDEVTILLQQNGAAQGLSYSSRALTYDDPTKSLVKDKMSFVAPPQGGGRLNSDGYSISAYTKKDHDLMFRLMMQAMSEKNMRAGKAMLLPTRLSVLQDAEIAKEFRHYPASLEAIKTGKVLPRLPELYSVGDFISRRINQAVTGEIPVKQALDLAAKETETFLARAGYYKG